LNVRRYPKELPPGSDRVRGKLGPVERRKVASEMVKLVSANPGDLSLARQIAIELEFDSELEAALLRLR